MLNIRSDIWNKNIILWKDCEPEEKSIKYFYKNKNEISGNFNIVTEIVKKDTIDSALYLKKKGYNPLVLNMADIYNPGGCVKAGGGMQEESIFRRSNYHKHLTINLYPIEENAAIYSHNVCVFRDNEDNKYENIGFNYLSFIACPGLSMPQLNNNDMFIEKDENIFKNKIKLILQIAYDKNHDSLVLGALGCGAFGCPVKHVAKLFYTEIKDSPYDFKLINFAILGKSFNIFKDYFNE